MTEQNGLVITSDPTQTAKPQKGEVIAIGADVKHVQVGDTVLYSQYGHEDLGEDDLVVVQESEIIGVWTAK